MNKDIESEINKWINDNILSKFDKNDPYYKVIKEAMDEIMEPAPDTWDRTIK